MFTSEVGTSTRFGWKIVTQPSQVSHGRRGRRFFGAIPLRIAASHLKALRVNCLFGLVDQKPQQLLHCDLELDQAWWLNAFLESLYWELSIRQKLASLHSAMLTFTIARA